jgi:AraC-like DNA-binding protein
MVLVQPSRLARRLLLHLFSIGCGHCRLPTRTDMAKPGVCFFWIHSGVGQMRLQDLELELKPGPDCWLYSLGRTRVFTPVSDPGFVSRTFCFGGPGLEAWMEELDAIRQPQFQLRDPTRVHQAYRAMLGLVQRRPSDWEWKVHLQLGVVLGELLRSRKPSHSEESPPAPSAIARVLDAIEGEPNRDWKTRELATLAGMSYTSFAELFSKTMHELPHAYLQRVRLDLAREMLTDPNLLMKEIAGQLHFSSEYYFSNFFYKHTGVRPTEFRQHLRLRPKAAQSAARSR